MTILAISPHLDDAIFSAGSTIARHVREGHRVVVATVFTASVPNPRGFALACQLDKGLQAGIDYMALRREEDRRACAILGAEPLWLPFPEAPHRGYHSASDLFEPMHDDDEIVAVVTSHLRDLIDHVRPTALWGPQAIGAHVDHVAVLEALLGLARSLTLWTDYPYAGRADVRPSPFARRLTRGRAELVPASCEDRSRKVEAVLAYESQLGFQFGGGAAAKEALARCGQHEAFVVTGEPT